MKITAIILLAGCLQVSAKTFSQNVNLSLKDAPLEQVFSELRKQTGFAFFYDRKEIKSATRITIEVKDMSLQETLNLCLKDQPVTYSIVEKTIVIKAKSSIVNLQSTATTKDVLSNFFPPPPLDISGRITNNQGEPLAGANVIIKRTGKGTITDANGKFSLNNVNHDDVIEISFIGYDKLIIKVGDRTNFTLLMDIATNKLDEVKVQAYGTTSDRLTTGNISKITSEEIARQPVMNVLNVLQGLAPGTVISNTTGFASSTKKVEIRGRNSINPNFTSDPLYIIDGVPLTILDITNSDSYEFGSRGIIQSGMSSPANGQSPFFNINPSDIESIEILKDADATAIYGSRGANGIILITTKKGKAGKTKFDINLSSGISKVPRYYGLLNTQQYIEMRKEALTNDGLPIDVSTAPDLVIWDTTRFTDWQRQFWGGTGKSTMADANISGGDNRTTFRISAGFTYQTEILTSSGANQRGSVAFNLNHKSLNQKFSVQLSSAYSFTSSDMIFVPGAINLPPNAPAIFNDNGKLNFSQWQPLDYLYPFSSLLQPYSTKTKLLNTNLVLGYELIKGLIFRTSTGYNNIQNSQKYFTPISSQNPIYNPTGSSSFGNSLVNNLIIEPQLDYSRIIDKGKFNILIGGSVQSNITSSMSLSGNGYKNDALLYSINNAPNKTSGNFEGQYKYAAFFGRISYNYKDKYIINVNGRRDGSSRFGPGKQFGNFGSIGTAWIFSQEKFIKRNFEFLSFGKIRGSYGTTGNDNIGDYAFLTKWGFGQFQYNGWLPLNATGHTDSILHWQVNKKAEVSITLGFSKDRIIFDMSFYRNRCNNQLVGFPTPLFTGFSNVTTNSPANVENKGWEFILNAKIFDNKLFKWSSKFNISINRNKLLSYPNLELSPYAQYYKVGSPLNIKKVLHFTGIDTQTGLYSFEDKNMDGQITRDFSGKTQDDTYTLDLSPKYFGGITNLLNYKNWEFSVVFYFKKQLGKNATGTLNAPGDVTNQPIEVLNRWQKAGDVADIARFTTNPYTNNSFTNYQQYADAVYTDASFIRLQNIYISYNTNDKVFRKTFFSNCRLFIQGQNLFIITKFKGLDPDVQNFTALPLSRIITAGISFKF